MMRNLQHSLSQLTSFFRIWQNKTTLETPSDIRSFQQSEILSFEQHLNMPVICFYSVIDEASLNSLYECLFHSKRTRRLALILSTHGGDVNVTRQIALLLREFVDEVIIYVPRQAKSAGTILCLSANEIVMEPRARLSPIDAQITLSGEKHSGLPTIISSEEIRGFAELAETWFNIDTEEHGIQLMNLLSQKIFPTTISAFYRADKLIQQIGSELLQFQIPHMEKQQLDSIIKQLRTGYHHHNYAIMINELLSIGLKVRKTTFDEELFINKIDKFCEKYYKGNKSNLIISAEYSNTRTDKE